jgi:flagellar protein FliO/FliZ
MSSISGLGFSGPVNLLLAFVAVLALIGLIAWVVRRIARERLGKAARTRQPRLAVLDTAVVDARRQLVIIRRDNVEHLLMIGGGSDLVIETNIVRASASGAARDTATRSPAALDAARTSQVYEGTSWPAPQPETSVRLQRTYPIEEPAQWAPPVQLETPLRADRPAAGQEFVLPQPGRQEPSVRPYRSVTQGLFGSPSGEVPIPPSAGPGPASPPRSPRVETLAAPQVDTHAATPVARPEPAPTVSAPPVGDPTNLAARLAARLEAPQRSNAAEPSSPNPTWGKPPAPPAAPRRDEQVTAPVTTEREINQAQPIAPDSRQKPAASARFSFPNLKFDRPSPGRPAAAAPKPDRPAARPAPTISPPEQSQPKPRTKTLYEDLEQEMASLLGKPPGK